MRGVFYGTDVCWPMILLSLSHAVPVRNRNETTEDPLATVSTITPRKDVCFFEGKDYKEGQVRPSNDPCEVCTCTPPSFTCMIRTCDSRPGCKALHSAGRCCPEYVCDCYKNGRTYGNGEKIEEPNPCNVCYCRGGEIQCTGVTCYTRTDCEPHYVSGKCCPKYDHCPAIVPQDTHQPTTTAPAVTTNTTLFQTETTTPTPPSTESSPPTISTKNPIDTSLLDSYTEFFTKNGLDRLEVSTLPSVDKKDVGVLDISEVYPKKGTRNETQKVQNYENSTQALSPTEKLEVTSERTEPFHKYSEEFGSTLEARNSTQKIQNVENSTQELFPIEKLEVTSEGTEPSHKLSELETFGSNQYARNLTLKTQNIENSTKELSPIDKLQVTSEPSDKHSEIEEQGITLEEFRNAFSDNSTEVTKSKDESDQVAFTSPLEQDLKIEDSTVFETEINGLKKAEERSTTENVPEGGSTENPQSEFTESSRSYPEVRTTEATRVHQEPGTPINETESGTKDSPELSSSVKEDMVVTDSGNSERSTSGTTEEILKDRSTKNLEVKGSTNENSSDNFPTVSGQQEVSPEKDPSITENPLSQSRTEWVGSSTIELGPKNMNSPALSESSGPTTPEVHLEPTTEWVNPGYFGSSTEEYKMEEVRTTSTTQVERTTENHEDIKKDNERKEVMEIMDETKNNDTDLEELKSLGLKNTTEPELNTESPDTEDHSEKSEINVKETSEIPYTEKEEVSATYSPSEIQQPSETQPETPSPSNEPDIPGTKVNLPETLSLANDIISTEPPALELSTTLLSTEGAPTTESSISPSSSDAGPSNPTVFTSTSTTEDYESSPGERTTKTSTSNNFTEALKQDQNIEIESTAKKSAHETSENVEKENATEIMDADKNQQDKKLATSVPSRNDSDMILSENYLLTTPPTENLLNPTAETLVSENSELSASQIQTSTEFMSLDYGSVLEENGTAIINETEANTNSSTYSNDTSDFSETSLKNIDIAGGETHDIIEQISKKSESQQISEPESARAVDSGVILEKSDNITEIETYSYTTEATLEYSLNSSTTENSRQAEMHSLTTKNSGSVTEGYEIFEESEGPSSVIEDNRQTETYSHTTEAPLEYSLNLSTTEGSRHAEIYFNTTENSGGVTEGYKIFEEINVTQRYDLSSVTEGSRQTETYPHTTENSGSVKEGYEIFEKSNITQSERPAFVTEDNKQAETYSHITEDPGNSVSTGYVTEGYEILGESNITLSGGTSSLTEENNGTETHTTETPPESSIPTGYVTEGYEILEESNITLSDGPREYTSQGDEQYPKAETPEKLQVHPTMPMNVLNFPESSEKSDDLQSDSEKSDGRNENLSNPSESLVPESTTIASTVDISERENILAIPNHSPEVTTEHTFLDEVQVLATMSTAEYRIPVTEENLPSTVEPGISVTENTLPTLEMTKNFEASSGTSKPEYAREEEISNSTVNPRNFATENATSDIPSPEILNFESLSSTPESPEGSLTLIEVTSSAEVYRPKNSTENATVEIRTKDTSNDEAKDAEKENMWSKEPRFEPNPTFHPVEVNLTAMAPENITNLNPTALKPESTGFHPTDLPTTATLLNKENITIFNQNVPKTETSATVLDPTTFLPSNKENFNPTESNKIILPPTPTVTSTADAPVIKKQENTAATLAEILLKWLQTKRQKADARKTAEAGRKFAEKKKEETVNETPVSLLSALSSELMKIAHEMPENRSSVSNATREGSRSLVFNPEKVDQSLEVHKGDIEVLAEALTNDGKVEPGYYPDEGDEPIHLRYPYTDESLAPVLSMISDQLQFLKVGEEQPIYIHQTPEEEAKLSRNHQGVVIVPNSSPLTVDMVKVVDGGKKDRRSHPSRPYGFR